MPTLNRNDLTDSRESVFSLTSRVVGRDPILTQLRALHRDAVAGTFKPLLVCGGSGMGKTALVEELRHDVGDGGLFVVAYHAPETQSSPLAGLMGAIEALVRQIEPDGKDPHQPRALQNWRQHLHEALGSCLPAFLHAFPGAAPLLGHAGTPTPLTLGAHADRLLTAVQRFFAAIAQRRPLVLVFEDLHWADGGTLRMFDALAHCDGQVPMFLIGTADGIGGEAQDVLTRLQRQLPHLLTLALDPLTPEGVQQLLSEALHAAPNEVLDLASFLGQHTAGHPLFMRLLLQTLWRRGLLQYAPASGHWDLHAASNSPYESLPSLIETRLESLDAPTRGVLETAAVAGHAFEADLIADVLATPVDAVEVALLEAQTADLVQCEPGTRRWRFAHAMIRELLLQRHDAAQLHSLQLKFGTQMLARHDRRPQGGSLLRALAPLIDAEAITPRMSVLCRAAAQQARAALDYGAALRVLTHLRFCEARGPADTARAMRDCLADIAELQAYHVAEEGDAALQTLLRDAHEPGDIEQAWRLRVQSAWHRGDVAGTHALGRAALRALGVTLPPLRDPLERWRLRRQLRRLTEPNALQRAMELSPCSASRARTTQQILANLVPACLTDSALLAQVVVTGLQQVAQEGPERAAWPALLAGAVSLHCQQGAADRAEPVRRILEQSLEGNHDASAAPWARFILLDCLESRRQTPEALARSYAHLGQEAAGAGDMATSAWALLGAAHHQAVLSVPHAMEQLERAQCLFAWDRLQIVHAAWAALRDMVQMLRADASPQVSMNEAAAPGEVAPWVIALWVKGQVRAAWTLGQRILAQPSWPTLDHACQNHLLFMAGLSALHAETSLRTTGRRKLRRVLQHLGRGTALWNLLTAEDGRRSQPMLRTAYLYDEACRMLADSRQHGLLAIAHECAARFFMGFDSARAALHLHQARDAYTQWGATVRLPKLEREFPEVLTQSSYGRTEAGGLGSAKLSHHTLDVRAIVNSISALSGEVVLTRLVQRVLQTVVENAGATRAIFVTCGAANLQVELDSAPHPSGVPHQLLWYVVRTRAPLLINGPAQDADFKRDPYIATRQPRCVLCAPVMHQGQTLALIYLENSLAADAFSADRVVLVQALASQAAISLENARIYQKLEAQVAARTHELAEAQAALMKTHQALRELDRAKSQFFANVSHEFRTPLTLILGPIEATMNNLALPEPVRHQLGMCQRNGLRLLRLVDDMLALSRLDSADLHLRLAPLNLGQALQDLVTQVQPWATRKDLSLHYEGEPHVILPADATELERVVLNLLNNAIKFTPPGGQITVRMRDEGSMMRVSVTDTGRGVPSDALEKIFDRFYQVETDVNKQAGGTGIGLALCRKIVELHGGGIGATSVLGNGTTVSFTLPREAPAGAVLAASVGDLPSGNDWYDSLRQREAYRLSAFETDETPAPTPTPEVSAAEAALVLLVDDKPEMLTYLASVLRDNYQICTAQDGLAGLHAARNMQPDLIISDVTMPGMSGYELLAALRADREMWHIPLVMLTARDAMEDRLAGIRRGADAYLTKPFAAAELHAVVAGLLAKQRSHRDAGRALRNAELQLLVAGISHEILNPLGFIRSALYLINEEVNAPLEGEVAMAERLTRLNEAVAAAREGVERVRTAVSQLRQFNTQGTLSPMQLTAPNRVVENVHRLTWHQIRFKTELSATRMVMARSGEIEQVLINLLNNAHHAAGPGGEVRVSTWDNHQGQVFLSVTDSGVGIPQDRLDAIFKPFVSSKVDGSGLGLYVSRQIVREHGGELRVSSAPGSGATFTIELPSADPQDAAPS